MYIHSNLHLIFWLKPDYNKGPSNLCDVNPEDANLDTPNCLMANHSFTSSFIDPFSVGDLDDASMSWSTSTVWGFFPFIDGGRSGSFITSPTHAASYHQSKELGVVPLKDVKGDDYLSDLSILL